MFSKLFRSEGFLWKSLNFLTDVFALSTLWLFCCIPVVTAGAATTALYDCVSRCLRFGGSGAYRRFFTTFRENLGVSTASTLFWGILVAAGTVTLNLLRSAAADSTAMKAFTAFWYVLMILPIGSACWAFPVLSRFTRSFTELTVTALKISVAYVPRSIVMVLLALEAVNLMVNYIFPAFFVPVLLMLLWSFFIEPVFEKLGGGIKGAQADGESEGDDAEKFPEQDKCN